LRDPGEALADHGAGTFMRTREHVSVDAQGEGRVLVPQVVDQLLDRDTSGQHDTGVVVAELVDAFPARGDIPASASPVCGRLRDQASLDEGRLPHDLRVVTGLDVPVVGMSPEQDIEPFHPDLEVAAESGQGSG